MPYLGDYTEDYATLNHKFTTRSAAGVPTDPVGLTVAVYKGAATGTESTAGVTLAATGNFDGVAGLNNLLIDLSADAFYAVGQDYHVIVTAGTVGGTSVVGEVICTFSIENRAGLADLTAVLADTNELQTNQGNWLTATSVGLNDDAITAAKFDETTAFPLKSADTGSTKVARTGADSDTLETLSDQIDDVPADVWANTTRTLTMSVTAAVQAMTGGDDSSFLSRTRNNIREFAGEPGTHAKYSDARLLEWIEMAYAKVFGALSRRADNPITLPFDITLSSDQRVYQLPPTCQRIVQAEIYHSSNLDQSLWSLYPRSRYNAMGAGLSFEHTTAKFSSDPLDDHVLRLQYVPAGCVKLHTASIDTDDSDSQTGSITNGATAATIVLPNQSNITSTGAGTLDTRPNAYAGCIFRVLSAGVNNFSQERLITEYNPGTRTIIVAPQYGTADVSSTLNGDPATGTTVTVDDNIFNADSVGLTITFNTTGNTRIIASVTNPKVCEVTLACAAAETDGETITISDQPLVPTSITGTDVVYEIAPPLVEQFDAVIAAWVAMSIVGLEGDKARYAGVSQLYQDMMAEAAKQVQYFDGITNGAHRDGVGQPAASSLLSRSQ